MQPGYLMNNNEIRPVDSHDLPDFRARVLVLPLLPYSCNYDCSIIFATSRIQRRYDHRLQAIVRSAGSIEIALEHGIPLNPVPRRPNVVSTRACLSRFS